MGGPPAGRAEPHRLRVGPAAPGAMPHRRPGARDGRLPNHRRPWPTGTAGPRGRRRWSPPVLRAEPGGRFGERGPLGRADGKGARGHLRTGDDRLSRTPDRRSAPAPRCGRRDVTTRCGRLEGPATLGDETLHDRNPQNATAPAGGERGPSAGPARGGGVGPGGSAYAGARKCVPLEPRKQLDERYKIEANRSPPPTSTDSTDDTTLHDGYRRPAPQKRRAPDPRTDSSRPMLAG